jgi:sulfopyruvate decarboxylase subunit beta
LASPPEKRISEILEAHGIEFASSLSWGACWSLVNLLQTKFHHIGSNREEEGVGISAGLSLGGGSAVIAIQSSGLGNSINALMSLHRTYHLPLPILVTWRGAFQEKSLHRYLWENVCHACSNHCIYLLLQ